MRLKKNKIIGFIGFSILLVLFIGFAIGTDDKFPEFTGDTCNCHKTTTTSLGTLSLSSNDTVTPGEIFTVSVQITGFNERDGADDVISVGFSPGRGDNQDFTISPTYKNDVSLSGGNSGTIDFQVTAPSSVGNYTLVCDALESGGGTINWLTGSKDITISDEPDDPDDPDDPDVDIGTIEFTNPNVSKSELELGEIQTITIKAVGTNTSVCSVTIEFDGTIHTMTAEEDDIYIYTNWKPSTIGMQQFTLKGLGVSGATGTKSGNFTVVDTIAPELDGPVTNVESIDAGSIVNIYITVTDASSIKNVCIEIEGQTCDMSFVGENTWYYELRTKEMSGTLEYEITAFDYNNNEISTTGFIKIIRDPFKSNLNKILIGSVFLIGGALVIATTTKIIQRTKLHSKLDKTAREKTLTGIESLGIKGIEKIYHIREWGKLQEISYFKDKQELLHPKGVSIFISSPEKKKIWLWKGPETDIRSDNIGTYKSKSLQKEYYKSYEIITMEEGNKPGDFLDIFSLQVVSEKQEYFRDYPIEALRITNYIGIYKIFQVLNSGRIKEIRVKEKIIKNLSPGAVCIIVSNLQQKTIWLWKGSKSDKKIIDIGIKKVEIMRDELIKDDYKIVHIDGKGQGKIVRW